MYNGCVRGEELAWKRLRFLAADSLKESVTIRKWDIYVHAVALPTEWLFVLEDFLRGA